LQTFLPGSIAGAAAAYAEREPGRSAHRLDTTSGANEQRSIAEIAYEFGFASDAHFSRTFRQQFGYSPREAGLGMGHGIHDWAESVDGEAGLHCTASG